MGTDTDLDRAFRGSAARVVGALAGRFRDLDLAEEAFAEACGRAAEAWPRAGVPHDPAAWLYRAAERRALDALRRREVRSRVAAESLGPEPEPSPEECAADGLDRLPDDRLRLIFVCCHPAIAENVRAALTLRLVCGLSTADVARAFLLAEPALAQRLVRAKRKIAEAGVPFEVPGPEEWGERLDAVLTTLEVAYAKAHEDAAGRGRYAGHAAEMLDLSAMLVELLPDEPEVLALAALIRFAEARRPARVDGDGAMVPLSEQDPGRWSRPLIGEGRRLLARAAALSRPGRRQLEAAIHGAWCGRRSLADAPPWPAVLALYDALLGHRDDLVVRLNRLVALAEVHGPPAALAELEALACTRLAGYLPYHALRADLLGRVGASADARAAYDRALALGPSPAERLWLVRRRDRS